MEKKNFFQTDAGRLTIAFLAIMAAFAVIMIGLYRENELCYLIGFLVVAAAMLYSPIKVHIYERLRKN